MNQGLMHCELGGGYWDQTVKKAGHSYFTKRNLQPFKLDNDFAFFKVNENLYVLPVEEIAIPASTFAVYRIFIKLPVMEARKVLRNRFGKEFRSSKYSRNGEVPELIKDEHDNKKSMLVC